MLAAIFGGTKTLISNPTGPMAVVTGQIILGLVEKLGLPEDYSISDFYPYLVIIGVLAGVFQIVLGLAKFRKYIHYIPTSFVSGFMSGIGVIIIISQIKTFLGVTYETSGAYDILANLPTLIANADSVSVMLASSTMIIIYLFPRITKAVPGPLVAIVTVTAVATLLGLHKDYLIPSIPQGLPKMSEQIAIFSNLSVMFTGERSHLVSYIITSGLYLAVIGVIDTLLTAVVADQFTKEKHNSNRELVGQGIGNAMSFMFGGMMGAGTTPATVLNIKSGARNRLSIIVHALILIIIL